MDTVSQGLHWERTLTPRGHKVCKGGEMQAARASCSVKTMINKWICTHTHTDTHTFLSKN